MYRWIFSNMKKISVRKFMNDDIISFLILSSFIKLYIIIIKNLKYYIACMKGLIPFLFYGYKKFFSYDCSISIFFFIVSEQPLIIFEKKLSSTRETSKFRLSRSLQWFKRQAGVRVRGIEFHGIWIVLRQMRKSGVSLDELHECVLFWENPFSRFIILI